MRIGCNYSGRVGVRVCEGRGWGTKMWLLKPLDWYTFGSEFPNSQREKVSYLFPIGKEGKVAGLVEYLPALCVVIRESTSLFTG